MNLRLALLELAERHRLDTSARAQLVGLAGLHAEPARLARWLPRGLAVLAAALGGFGVILWIAANWETLGRFGRFGLLMVFVGVMGAGAAWRPAARAPLGLLALLGIGALFAYFGQTYQTGADPWQLFALWAVLALPLCLGARSDVLWAPWALVVATGVSLWVHAQVGQRWRVAPEDLGTHAAAWLLLLALAALLSRALQRWTGAGPWALRTAVTLAVAALGLSALSGLFDSPVAPHYGLGLLVLAVGAGLLCWRPAFDLFALSAVALGLNVLIVAGVARAMFDSSSGDPIGRLLVLGLLAAGLLAASVSGILKLARRQGAEHG
ncbi:DUF2157 domain-containing protein [Sphaerotilaceae bacterium SBD11-9]